MFKKKIFALILLFGLANPVVSNASSESYKEVYNKEYESVEEFTQGRSKLPKGAVLTGSFDDKELTLDFDNEWFLHAPIIDPCDTFESYIRVTNKSKKDMKVRLIDIINQLKDDSLYNKFVVRIYKDGELIYDGGLDSKDKDVIDWFTVKQGETVTLRVELHLPCDAGNDIQDKELVTSWLFEGRVDDDKPDKPVPEKPTDPTPDKPKPTPDKPDEPKETVTQTSGMNNINQYLNIMLIVLLMLVAALLVVNIKKDKVKK